LSFAAAISEQTVAHRSAPPSEPATMYLWRDTNSEGEVLDILVQSRRNKKAAVKLLRKLLKKQKYGANKVVTDKQPS